MGIHGRSTSGMRTRGGSRGRIRTDNGQEEGASSCSQAKRMGAEMAANPPSNSNSDQSEGGGSNRCQVPNRKHH